MAGEVASAWTNTGPGPMPGAIARTSYASAATFTPPVSDGAAHESVTLVPDTATELIAGADGRPVIVALTGTLAEPMLDETIAETMTNLAPADSPAIRYALFVPGGNELSGGTVDETDADTTIDWASPPVVGRTISRYAVTGCVEEIAGGAAHATVNPSLAELLTTPIGARVTVCIPEVADPTGGDTVEAATPDGP